MQCAAVVVVLKQLFIFFLHCANFNNQKQTLFDKTTFTDVTILTENEDSYLVNQVVKILLTEQL